MAKNKGLKAIDWIAFILVTIGALNWGLVGAFGFNLVEWIFTSALLLKWVYILVGLSAVWSLASIPRMRK